MACQMVPGAREPVRDTLALPVGHGASRPSRRLQVPRLQRTRHRHRRSAPAGMPMAAGGTDRNPAAHSLSARPSPLTSHSAIDQPFGTDERQDAGHTARHCMLARV